MTITDPNDARLTHKQQRFIAEYLIDGNGSAAYQRAGYHSTGNVAEVAACRLLRNVQVRFALEEARRQLSEVTSLDAQWVDERLMSVVESCCEPVPILDRQGQPTGRFTFDSMGALKGLELLAKRLQLFSSEEPQPGAPEQPIAVHLPPPVLLEWDSRIRAQQERGANPVPPEDPPRDPPPVVPPPSLEVPPENPSTNAPERTETQCCFACQYQARGGTHRLQHTADCRRCRTGDPLIPLS